MDETKKRETVEVDLGVMLNLVDAYRSTLFYNKIFDKVEIMQNELAENILQAAINDNSKRIDVYLEILLREFKPSLFE